ncbi:MAG: M48 family metallopeptidase [Bacillota bacterium]|nr:M48 family metallopeptidase [Bacillota bacterium]
MHDHNSDIRRAKIGWFLLTGLAVVLALLYLRSSLFPGPIDPSVTEYFSLSIANKARLYNSNPRILYILKFFLQTILLVWLLVSSKGQTYFQRLQTISRNYWVVSALSVLSLWLFFKALSLPFSYYTGYYWQKVWGFSTQSQVAWWSEYLKSSGIDLLVSLAGGLIFFGLVNRLSRYWWMVGASLLSIWLVITYLLSPIVISPLFNHFESLTDPAVVTMVDDLAQQAGLNIDAVLVMDASRQTTLGNAYYTGLGATKRIVIYDTLLRGYSLPEIKAVLAHEMGHWRYNDIIHGLFYAMAGSFVVFFLLTFLLKPWFPYNSKKPPQLWAALQLALILLLFVSSPLQNAISREMEIRADHFSFELTRDLTGEIQLQKKLAYSGLSDLSPPSFIVWFSYNHPPALARIKALEKASLQSQSTK